MVAMSKLGRTKEAEKQVREVIKIMENTMQPSNLLFATMKINFSLRLMEMGKHEEAERLLRKVITGISESQAVALIL